MQANNSKTYGMIITAMFTAIIVVMALTPLGFIPLVVINATTIHIPVILGSIFLGPKKGGFLGGVFGLTSCLKSTFVPSSLSAFVFSPVIAVSVVGPAGIIKSLLIAFVPRILIGVVPYFVYIGIKSALSSEKKMVWGSIINLVVSLIIGFGVKAFFSKLVVTAIEKQAEMSATLVNFCNNLSPVTILVIAVIVAVVAFVVIEILFIKKDAKLLGFVTAGICGAMTNTLLVMGGIFVLYKEPYSEAVGVAADALLAMIAGVISFNGVVEAIVAAVIVSLVGLALDKITPAGSVA